MRIVNARLGFANNSSSSHSMIIMSKDNATVLSGDEPNDYGWNNFTLTSAEAKLDYLATAIWQQLSNQGNPVTALVVARDIMGLPEWSPKGEIDHQSTFELPASPNGAPIDVSFARAFAEWIQSEGVVVLGGNDNSDGHPLASDDDGDALPFGREAPNPFVAKFDDASGTWTLFNKSNGAKLRMAFEPGEALELEMLVPGSKGSPRPAIDVQGEPPKMGTPELVDVKITDYCDIGCAYCYQGSTTAGKHASMDDIRTLAREFFKAGVLEVALGGGEPTRHPHFVEILEIFSAHGIVANFTTRDLSYLSDPAARARIQAASSSVAVSVSSAQQVQDAQDAWRANGGSPYMRVPFSFQYVIGTASDAELAKIVSMSAKEHLNLTLLGYKDSGRGQSWREGAGKVFALREAKVQSQSSAWIGFVKESMGERSYSRVCIDTALARESEALLAQEGIGRHLWHKSEGLVSMYVDAVAMSMGKSSYEPSERMEPFAAGWMDVFEHWLPTADESARSKRPDGASHE